MAIKIITPDEDEVPEDLMIEIALLKQCDHKNIVKYYGGYRKGDEIFVRIILSLAMINQEENSMNEKTTANTSTSL